MNNGFNRHNAPGSMGGSVQNALNIVIRRHLFFASGSPEIVVRQVRRIVGSQGITAFGSVTGQNMSPDIGVTAVRPYSRTSRASSYWQDSGWEMRNGYLIGLYRAGTEQFPGTIEIRDSYVQPFKFYIYDPPSRVLDGPHGACFRYENEINDSEKYFIHFSEEPKDLDSGIIQIERDISP